MKKLLLAGLICSASIFADTVTGYISDSHCGAKHNAPSAANTKCIVDMCLNGGADPVLVQDGKVMKFDADSKQKVMSYAGKNVTIDGTVDGDTLKVNSISEAK